MNKNTNIVSPLTKKKKKTCLRAPKIFNLDLFSWFSIFFLLIIAQKYIVNEDSHTLPTCIDLNFDSYSIKSSKA